MKITLLKTTMVALIAAVTITNVKGYSNSAESIPVTSSESSINRSRLLNNLPKDKQFAVTYTYAVDKAVAAGVGFTVGFVGYFVTKAIYRELQKSMGGISNPSFSVINEELQLKQLD